MGALVKAVLAVRRFLDAELAKGWKDSQESLRVLFESKHASGKAIYGLLSAVEMGLKVFLSQRTQINAENADLPACGGFTLIFSHREHRGGHGDHGELFFCL